MGFYTEAAKQLINPMDVPSFFIECARTENMLFEGLIELDFAHVYNETGIISISEADEENANLTSGEAINKAIKDIWKIFTDTITKVWSDIKAKFEEFIKKTASLVSSKVINNDKAKECNTKDIWYADYKKACDDIINKGNIGAKAAAITDDLAKKTKDGASEEEVTKAAGDFGKEIDKVYAIPTEADKVESAEIKIPVVELGSKASEFNNLQEELSLAGLTKRLSSAFGMLVKDDSQKFKVEKDDSAETKKLKHLSSKAATKIRLSYFKAECKICSNTAKIARRNYSEIKAFVKGGKAEGEGKEESQNSSAIFAAIGSNLLCESIFDLD